MARTPHTTSQVVTGIHDQLPVPTRATTSRTVVSNDAARVVVFAFDAGEQLTDHAAGRPVVVQVNDGRLRFRVDGTDHELVAGDVVYLAPGARHALEALEASRVSLVLIEPGG